MSRPVIFAFRAPNEPTFERQAEQAMRLGATHVIITEDLPRAFWQFDVPDDPYPAWFAHQPGLLKIFPPPAVRTYVDFDFAQRVAAILENRCKILRKLGLRAYYWTNEPQVLPERFFIDCPRLRGPRVDHPNRSRAPRFAPCTDQPEVLALYREAMQALLAHCPEVDLFSFMTTDSGSGFCWAGALYPGRNGNPDCRERRMNERVAGFLTTLQDAARDTGHEIAIDIVEVSPRPWMLPTFDDPESLAGSLPPGLAINHREGPDGRPFMTRSFEGLWWNTFYPVIGLPRPVEFVRKLADDERQPEARQLVHFSDWLNTDLYFVIFERYRRERPVTALERMNVLRAAAGENEPDILLDLWLCLDEVELLLGALDFGPVILMGCVLGRWITRPLVPYPAELTFEEKRHYRPFLFQAKSEQEADNLIDIQAMRMFEGWGARLLVQNVARQVLARLDEAAALAAELSDRMLEQRLAVLACFVRTVEHVVAYQAQLDRVRRRGTPPEPVPPLGAHSDWERTDLMGIARDEIANVAGLHTLIGEGCGDLIDTAARPEEEMILQLGPDVADHLKRKIDTMNRHWSDYDRLFTAPNP